MEDEPPVVALAGPDGDDVGDEVAGVDVFADGDREDAFFASEVPDWVRADGFEEVFYEVLDIGLELGVGGFWLIY